MALIRDHHYGYRDFALDGQARFRLTRWLYALCWASDDRPGLLIDRATAWLVGNKVLLPGISTIERLVARVRHRAWRILATAPTQEQRQCNEALLDAERGELTMTLERLRAAPTRRSPTELTRSLERLSTIRAQMVRPTILEGFPSAALLRLARFGHRVRPAVLTHLPEPRRTATLVALLLHSLEATAQDDAVELFEALAAEVTGDAAKAHVRRQRPAPPAQSTLLRDRLPHGLMTVGRSARTHGPSSWTRPRARSSWATGRAGSRRRWTRSRRSWVGHGRV